MHIEMLIGKLHQAVVTQCDLHYHGSITIDADLLEAAHFLPHQKVDVYNINNGLRFTTYTIAGPAGSGIIGINGAAARLCSVGDQVIIVAYGSFTPEEAREHLPTVVLLDAHNRPAGLGT